jgi:hypothetical protein
MKEKYREFHDLIVLCHDALLTPRQIFERFLAQGVSPARAPSPGMIRHLGIHLLGARCKWNRHNMRSWRAPLVAPTIFWKTPKRRS